MRIAKSVKMALEIVRKGELIFIPRTSDNAIIAESCYKILPQLYISRLGDIHLYTVRKGDGRIVVDAITLETPGIELLVALIRLKFPEAFKLLKL
jgi:hypothetical protein